MKIEDISHKSTLKAIAKNGITMERLDSFADIKELRAYIASLVLKRWREKNRGYWIDRYSSDEEYREKVKRAALERYADEIRDKDPEVRRRVGRPKKPESEKKPKRSVGRPKKVKDSPPREE